MLEAAKDIFLVVSALFPIVDPLGGSPIFLALTRGDSSAARRALSRRIALNSFFLLVGSYLIGTYILDFFGISLPVVQVGGGLIVISTGWAMLKQKPDEEHKVTRRKIQQEDPLRRAFYPLTLPLTVGPGSISVAITLGANAVHHHGLDLIAITVSIVGINFSFLPTAIAALSGANKIGFAPYRTVRTTAPVVSVLHHGRTRFRNSLNCFMPCSSAIHFCLVSVKFGSFTSAICCCSRAIILFRR